MDKDLTRHPIFIAAALLVAAGILLAARAAARAPDQVRQIHAKAERLDRLHRIAQEQAVPEALLAALAAASATRPADLKPLLETALPGVSHNMEEGDPTPLADGWSLRSVRLILDDAPLDEVAAFAAGVETGRPPWRVVEYRVIPGPVSGRGRVTLTLEALTRS